MMFALLKSSVCELWFSKELFSALLLLLVIFMALISFLITVSWYYSRLRRTTVIFSSELGGKIRLFSVLLCSIYSLFMWLDGGTAVFTGRRSFTKVCYSRVIFLSWLLTPLVPEELIIYFHPLLVSYCFIYLFRFWVLNNIDNQLDATITVY